MNRSVDKELCIGCGISEIICPDVFEMKDDDKSHVKNNPVSAEHKECVFKAENECPVDAYNTI